MEMSQGNVSIEDSTLEKVQEFYEWLQGGAGPEKIEFRTKPRLTEDEAFSVVYYLQEELGILPDCYEQCRKCKGLYDSCNEGTSIDKDSTIVENGKEVDGNFQEELYGLYCDNCRPD